MNESGYYPMGAENDPRAPWNETENTPREFGVEVECYLTKQSSIESSDYDEYAEKDEDGTWISEVTTDDIEWESEWAEQHHSVTDLLDMLAMRLQNELDEAEADKTLTSVERKRRVRRLRNLISECEGWEESELSVTTE